MNALHYYSLDKSELLSLAKFVVQENYNHHCTSNNLRFSYEVKDIFEEETKFSNSKVFVTRGNDFEIVGSIRVLKWNKKDILPIEKIFNIKPNYLTNSKRSEIWHIGRFAIKKGIDKLGFNVFKTLMVCALNEVCKNENSIALAECDAKLLKIIKILGIDAIVLADSINYLGSETIPVLLTYKSLKSFLDKNRYLLSTNFTQLHQSVVFQATA